MNYTAKPTNSQMIARVVYIVAMKVQTVTVESQSLNREMKWLVAGQVGLPVLIIPSQNGHEHEWYEHGMLGLFTTWVESGLLRLYCCDGMDEEIFQAKTDWSLYEAWLNHISLEAASFFDWEKVVVIGASLGGYHAMNLAQQFPQLFLYSISLSGLYEVESLFGQTNYNPIQHQMPKGEHWCLVGQKEDESFCLSQWRHYQRKRPAHVKLKRFSSNYGHDWASWFKQCTWLMNQLMANQIVCLEACYDRGLEQLIRSCLIEYGANHEGTAWADPYLSCLSTVYDGQLSQYWVLVNSLGQVLAGCGIGYLEGSICELQKMYSHPSVRSLGYAAQLLEKSLDFAQGHYEACYLETLPQMKAAMRFYEKHGFEHTSQRFGHTGHDACDVSYIKRFRQE